MIFNRGFLTNLSNTKLFIKHKYKISINKNTNSFKKYNINKFARNSLKYDNDAKRRSMDEAISIHIITEKLKTKLKILYESQISNFHGKPDFIIRLGKDFYIMVSITRAMQKNSVFTSDEAYRLIKKKMDGIYICSNNLDCLINDVILKYRLQPIVHVLAPNKYYANLCVKAYKKYCYNFNKKTKKIKFLISIIDFTDEIAS